jgi:hypothetical protein
MASEIDQPPLGLRVLMWVSLLVGVWALLDLVSAVHPLYLSQYAFPETRAQRAISIVVGLSFGPLFFGIRRRSAVAWKFGWVVLIATFSWFLVESVQSILEQTQSGGLVTSAVMTIMISAVAIYWGRWWKRQKNYFQRDL